MREEETRAFSAGGRFATGAEGVRYESPEGILCERRDSAAREAPRTNMSDLT